MHTGPSRGTEMLNFSHNEKNKLTTMIHHHQQDKANKIILTLETVWENRLMLCKTSTSRQEPGNHKSCSRFQEFLLLTSTQGSACPG